MIVNQKLQQIECRPNETRKPPMLVVRKDRVRCVQICARNGMNETAHDEFCVGIAVTHGELPAGLGTCGFHVLSKKRSSCDLIERWKTAQNEEQFFRL